MRRLALTFVALLALAHPLRAEPAYPQTTIRIVLGFGPGSAPDVAARVLAERFTAAWGKPVVVENMLGAGGNIAADHVAKAAPDGATLLMAGNAAIVINPSLYAKLPYDPARDLVPVAQVTIAPNVLVLNKDVPTETVQDLVALTLRTAALCSMLCSSSTPRAFN